MSISSLIAFLKPGWPVIKLVIFGLVAINVALINAVVIIYIERKLLGDIQFRLSIMRVGFHGILQPIADLVKFLTKEDIIPKKADRFLFVLAPFMFFIPTVLLLMMVPISKTIAVVHMDLGFFFFFAVLTVMPIGIIFAGWASNSKYSLIGGLRGAAQQLSYEIPLILSALGVVMMAGSLNLVNIVQKQQGLISVFGFKTFIPSWFIFYQPFGFALFFIAVLADTYRPPFDLPEAESEIIAGPFTEYSSIKYIIFVLTEYFALIVMSVFIALVFLGGWNGPFLPPMLWLILKTYFIVFLTIWVRGTLPRLRIDQLMNLGWKILLPLSFLNITLTGIMIAGIKR